MIKIIGKIFLYLILVVGASSSQASLFGAQEFYLDNGMRVIVIPNHKAPIIKHMVWYKVGSVDEQLGKGGTAHLLEHLMFRGTKKIKDSDFNNIIEKNGGDSNAFTGQDYTSYHQSLDISKLELAMFLEADRMKNLDFNDQAFAMERDIVFQERKQVVENNPSSYFYETISRSFWQEHPYARPITGSPEEINNLQAQDIMDFYNNYYTPSNAILVLAGDIDVETAKKLAKKYYGVIEDKKVTKITKFPILDKKFEAKVEMSLPRINSTRLMKRYLAASNATDKSKVYNLTLLSKYLGEGETSKLYKKLVLEKQKVLNVSTSYDGMSRSYGSFMVSVVPKAGVSAEELNQILMMAINESIEEINLDEIEKVKQKMLSGLVYLRDNPNDAAYIVGSMAVNDLSLDEIEQYADGVKAVDYKSVKSNARNLFNNQSNLLGILKPIKEMK